MNKNSVFEKLNTPINLKKVFVIAFSLGILCHMAMYTQFYLGHDANTYWNDNARWDIITGRFVGTYIKHLHNSLQVPWMIGIISNLFLAASVVLMASVLRIKRMVLGVALAIVTVTWPSITSSHGYLYMLTQFTFAMLTSVLAVYVLERWRYGWLGSIGLLIISLGCYQAYIGLTAVLMLLRIVQECAFGNRGVKKTILYGMRCLGILVVSIGIYYVLWQLLIDINGYAATSYKNMDKLGFQFILTMLLHLADVYKYVIGYFLVPIRSYMPGLVRWSIILSCVVSTVYMGKKVCWNGNREAFEKIGNIILCGMCYLLFPLAMNAGQFLSQSRSATQMETAFLLPILLTIVVYDEFMNERKDILKGYGLVSSICLGACVFLSGYNGIYGANACYLKLRYNHESALMSVSQALNVLSAEENYTLETPVVLLGDYDYIPSRAVEGFEWCNDVTGIFSSSFTYDEPLLAIFRQYCPSVNIVWYYEDFEDLPEVQELEALPSNRCKTWVGDTLVIKVNGYHEGYEESVYPE